MTETFNYKGMKNMEMFEEKMRNIVKLDNKMNNEMMKWQQKI